MPESESYRAYQSLNRSLEEIDKKRRSINKTKEELEEKNCYFNNLAYEVQDILSEVSDPCDEEWNHLLLLKSNQLNEDRNEVFARFNTEHDRLEEERLELLRQEDRAHETYEKVKRQAQVQKESEQRSNYY